MHRNQTVVLSFNVLPEKYNKICIYTYSVIQIHVFCCGGAGHKKVFPLDWRIFYIFNYIMKFIPCSLSLTSHTHTHTHWATKPPCWPPSLCYTTNMDAVTYPTNTDLYTHRGEKHWWGILPLQSETEWASSKSYSLLPLAFTSAGFYQTHIKNKTPPPPPPHLKNNNIKLHSKITTAD